MNEPDLMNNKFQLHEAMEEARDVIGQVFDEFGELTGREYGTPTLTKQRMPMCCWCC